MDISSVSCQNCKTAFPIEPDDREFYAAMKVPAPTFCPPCRLQRRLAFRNERSLYKRTCARCGKDMLSVYHPEAPVIVYCNPCWWSDGWDPYSYGRDYDFSKSFFEQWKALSRVVPFPALSTIYQTLVNSEYTNMVGHLKNCYLLFNSDYSENCAYGSEIESSTDSFDNLMINKCELCYGSVNLNGCYRAFFSTDCEDSRNIWFCKNLVGCSDCIGCANLRGKRYCIFNEQCSKEEYERRAGQLQFSSYAALWDFARTATEFHKKFPVKYIHGLQNNNVSGDYIYNSRDVKNSFIVTESQHAKYCLFIVVKPMKDCWDYTEYGDNAQRMYEVAGAGLNASDIMFSFFCFGNAARLQYCGHCPGSSDMFGCAGLKKGTYAILNKRYSKEEYDALMKKIISHMDAMPYTDAAGRTYRYGEFFPIEMSAFAYNEASVFERFPLSPEDARAQGYVWRRSEERSYENAIASETLPDEASDVPEGIMNAIIACPHAQKCSHQCSGAFRLIGAEVQFLRQTNLPFPRLCPNCRHHERLERRNPFSLRTASCACAGTKNNLATYMNTAAHFHANDPCPHTFETAYPEGGSDIVYCQECYQAEVV